MTVITEFVVTLYLTFSLLALSDEINPDCILRMDCQLWHFVSYVMVPVIIFRASILCEAKSATFDKLDNMIFFVSTYFVAVYGTWTLMNTYQFLSLTSDESAICHPFESRNIL